MKFLLKCIRYFLPVFPWYSLIWESIFRIKTCSLKESSSMLTKKQLTANNLIYMCQIRVKLLSIEVTADGGHPFRNVEKMFNELLILSEQGYDSTSSSNILFSVDNYFLLVHEFLVETSFFILGSYSIQLNISYIIHLKVKLLFLFDENHFAVICKWVFPVRATTTHATVLENFCHKQLLL